MAIPHIMPLGFIHRRTEAGAIIMLNNPQESQTLKLGTPITLWWYSPGPARGDSASSGRNSLLLMTKPVGQVP